MSNEDKNERRREPSAMEIIHALAHEMRRLRLRDNDDTNTNPILQRIEKKVEIIMATQAEAAVQIRNLTATINKIGGETARTLQKVKDLEEVIRNTVDAVTPELAQAMTEAEAAAKAADDLTPDEVVVPPPAE